MFFVFLLLLSSVPIFVGLTILVLFQKNALSKVVCLFLIMVACWQLDIAFLYAHDVLSEQVITFFFKLFRFGSIMVPPTLFFVSYIVFKYIPQHIQKGARWCVNKWTVIGFYLLEMVIYIMGWTDQGVQQLQLIEVGYSAFYFPIYGPLTSMFIVNMLLVSMSVMTCIWISMHIQHAPTRSFLIWFNIVSIMTYMVGTLNMVPEMKLYPSSIAVLMYALSTFVLCNRMYVQTGQEMNDKLVAQKNFLFQVIDLNPNYIYAKDQHGRYTLANEAYAQLLNHSVKEVIGKTDQELGYAFTLTQQKNVQLQTVVHATAQEVLVQSDCGPSVWVQTSKTPIDGGLLTVATDITERKQFEQKIQFQAAHDALTSLPNRYTFQERLTTLLQQAKHRDEQVAVIFLDLDRFKYINDTLGHHMGDVLLIEVGKRIVSLIQQSHDKASVYRVGGDEFVILIEQCEAACVEQFAQALLQQFKPSFFLGVYEHVISASIGISMFPQNGDDAETLIKHADTAMYDVKAKGKNSYQLFTAQMHEQFYRKMMIEKHLRTALARQELTLHYQPIVDVKTNTLKGMESLIRWHNDVLGFVPPDEFISIAEETGLIVPIGEWVLKTAIAQQMQWQQQTSEQLYISVNVSVRQLLDPTFVPIVEQALVESGVPRQGIVLEITESMAMYDEVMLEKLHALRALGVKLSMDDFGTGYSSLSYVGKYPIDAIKIDRSFVRGMMQDEEKLAIVNMVVAIGKQLQITVIAEGVEERVEYAFLQQMGCDCAQGYYISRPLPAQQATTYVTMPQVKLQL